MSNEHATEEVEWVVVWLASSETDEDEEDEEDVTMRTGRPQGSLA